MNPIVIGLAIFRELGKIWQKESEKKGKDKQALLLYAKYQGKTGPNQLIYDHIYKLYIVLNPQGEVSIRLADRSNYLEYDTIEHFSCFWVIIIKDQVSKAFCRDFKVPCISKEGDL